MRSRATLWAATAVAGLLLGQAALAQDTVVFWQFSTRDADIAAWNEAIASFEAANPDVKVDMEIVPWAEQQQRLVTALTTGGLPDVSMLGNNVVAQFQAAGALAPLDEYFAAYGAEHGYDVAADAWPGDKGYYNLDDHWWASPVIVETRALYYRNRPDGAGRARPERAAADLGRADRRRGEDHRGDRHLRLGRADEPRLLHHPELHEHLPLLRRADARRRGPVRLRLRRSSARRSRPSPAPTARA